MITNVPGLITHPCTQFQRKTKHNISYKNIITCSTSEASKAVQIILLHATILLVHAMPDKVNFNKGTISR